MRRLAHGNPELDAVRGGAQGEVGVNAAFLQDIKDDGSHLTQLLQAVTSILEANRIHRVQKSLLSELLACLYAQLQRRFFLEESLGYVDDAMNVAPRLSTQAQQLRAEHLPLLTRLQVISHMTSTLLELRGYSFSVQTEIREEFADFQRQLLSHEARENDLIVETLYFDIGGGD